MAAIKVGDTLPDFTFFTLKDDKPEPVKASEAFANKKVVLFAVPGAYTPTCTKLHCPGFGRQAQEIKKKGVDLVACTATNDAFVLDAWGEYLKTKDAILFLADGNGDFAKSIGMELDLRSRGMGIRSKRYAIILENRVVKWIGLDESGLDKSSAEAVLAHLG